MISARELLEQADALMRRGRVAADDDIPVLEDVVELGSTTEAAGRPAEPVSATDAAASPSVPDAIAGGVGPTAVEGLAGESAAALQGAGQDVTATAAVTGQAIAEAGEIAAMEGKEIGFVAFGAPDLPVLQPIDAWIPGLTRPASSPSIEPAAVPAPGADPGVRESRAIASAGASAGSHAEPPWAELREQLLATVMQRLELLTDQAVADQLAQRVRPVVERAGAELVDRIGGEMRELVRACVAEAIEREIAAMRDARTRPGSP